jgi:hypothetical protein
MGYCMDQRDSSVFIAKKDRSKVKAAINALMSRAGAQSGGKFRWVDTDTVLQARTLDEQLEEWLWAPEYDADGNIVDLVFQGEKAGDDIELFKAIAPYVRADSFIEMHGEDGSLWRWHFDGADCEELDAEVRFTRPKKGAIIDVEATEVTARSALVGKAKALPKA